MDMIYRESQPQKNKNPNTNRNSHGTRTTGHQQRRDEGPTSDTCETMCYTHVEQAGKTKMASPTQRRGAQVHKVRYTLAEQARKAKVASRTRRQGAQVAGSAYSAEDHLRIA